MTTSPATDTTSWGALPLSPGLAGLLPAGTAAVVTGQQPALGGGPLYTLVKTAHAVALARQVARAGRPCRAMHWVASEDHDVGEAGHADVIGRDGRLTRISDPLGGGRASLRFRRADHGWEGLRTALDQVCGPGPGRAFIDAQAPRADEDLGTWQGRLLQACFPDLVVIQPHQLRQAGVPVLRQALEAWPRLRPALEKAGWSTYFGEALEPPVFADGPAGRQALSRDQALELLQRDPSQVSTGAGLRPVLQQATLPVLAYVGGPGEIAYHQALAPWFPALGLLPPRLVPRLRANLAPSWYLRGCAGWGMDPQDPQAPAPEPTSDTALAALDQALQVLANRQDLRGAHRRLTKIRQHTARRLRNRAHPIPAGTLVAWYRPRETPQDRVMSTLQALWEWGPGLAEVLVQAAMTASPGQEVLITPSGAEPRP